MKENKTWRDVAVFINLGWMMALSLGLCILGGLYLDKRNQTQPLFLLIGVFLAFAISGYLLFSAIRNNDEDSKEN